MLKNHSFEVTFKTFSVKIVLERMMEDCTKLPVQQRRSNGRQISAVFSVACSGDCWWTEVVYDG